MKLTLTSMRNVLLQLWHFMILPDEAKEITVVNMSGLELAIPQCEHWGMATSGSSSGTGLTADMATCIL